MTDDPYVKVVTPKGAARSQTQTVDPMFVAFYAWWTSAARPIELGQREREFNCWKAGAAWAAKTPAECAVLEAAIAYSKTTGGGSTVRALRNVLNAVAALEWEKVEGAGSGPS